MSQTAGRAQRGQVLMALAFAGLVTPPALQGQEEPQNLQVLPKDMPRSEVTRIMRSFTQAVDVRCSSCHVGEEGQPRTTYDFASDDKAMKLKARAIMRMVEDINGTYLADLPGRREPGA
ncbi:MAG TPA: c-type cytochrome [Longimicrobiales bacterium]|nr:c-type cytochrome [Longimicrobiales bacterium]